MQRISSRNTFFLKRVMPLIALGGLLLFLASPYIGGRPPFAWLFVSAGILVFVCVVGWFILKRLVFNLADEVFDAGDALLVRKDGRQDRIPLGDIVRVDASLFIPGRVTLVLKRPSIFGTEISFLAQVGALPFLGNPALRDLAQRVAGNRAG